MASHKAVTQKIESRFIQYWPHDYPAQMDSNRWANQKGDYEQPSDEIWVRFKVIHGAGNFHANCNAKITTQRTGVVNLWVYYPKNCPSYEAMSAIECFTDILENKSLDEIYTHQASIIDSAPVSNWEVVRASIPFRFYDKQD